MFTKSVQAVVTALLLNALVMFVARGVTNDNDWRAECSQNRRMFRGMRRAVCDLLERQMLLVLIKPRITTTRHLGAC